MLFNQQVECPPHSLVIRNEVNYSNLSRDKLPKSLTSYKDRLNSMKPASQVRAIELRSLHQQIDALPETLKESVRCNYILKKDSQKRDMQEFQFFMVDKVEKLLRKQMKDIGIDWRRFKIGGHERGVYGGMILENVKFYFLSIFMQSVSSEWNQGDISRSLNSSLQCVVVLETML